MIEPEDRMLESVQEAGGIADAGMGEGEGRHQRGGEGKARAEWHP